MSNLLIIYHSQAGSTESLARAVMLGAERTKGVSVVLKKSADVGEDDLMDARVIVICSPEYFGYMAGMMKDMFDRTYEQVREKSAGVPYCLVVRAGNDGTGCLNSMERIIKGLGWRKVQDPLISNGPVTDEHIDKCAEIGATLSAGMDLGIY